LEEIMGFVNNKAFSSNCLHLPPPPPLLAPLATLVAPLLLNSYKAPTLPLELGSFFQGDEAWVRLVEVASGVLLALLPTLPKFLPLPILEAKAFQIPLLLCLLESVAVMWMHLLCALMCGGINYLKLPLLVASLGGFAHSRNPRLCFSKS